MRSSGAGSYGGIPGDPAAIHAATEAMARAQRMHAQAVEDAQVAHARGSAAAEGSPERYQTQGEVNTAEECMASAKEAVRAAEERGAARIESIRATIPTPLDAPAATGAGVGGSVEGGLKAGKISSLPGLTRTWGEAGKVARGSGVALPFVAAGVGQYLKDENAHPHMGQDRRVARAVGQGLMTGGASVGGASIGLALGRYGGPVTAVAGAVAGGIGAGALVEKFAGAAVDGFGEAGAWTNHEAHRFPRARHSASFLVEEPLAGHDHHHARE